ncbi:MAG TPA: GGDEF domain-containing protein [Thermoanaerobaculia bacterium]
MLLGVGAPAGAFALRVASGAAAARELARNAFFYLYELVGTSLIFGIAGYFVGRRADRLRHGRDRYRDLSERDPLTGLVNARTFAGRYRRALARAGRYQEPLSLLIIDVDCLKALNDEFGHAFGSAALLRVAAALRAAKREDDMAARWGGDEFALLMPGADTAAARRQAEAILERLRKSPVEHAAGSRFISVTIGVATSAGGAADDDLFGRADRALYEGKRRGRGQIAASE